MSEKRLSDAGAVSFDLFADDLGDLFSFDVHLHALHEPFFHFFQLPDDAAVVHRAADPRHQAAQDRRIDFGAEQHGSAGQRREAFLNRLRPRRV